MTDSFQISLFRSDSPYPNFAEHEVSVSSWLRMPSSSHQHRNTDREARERDEMEDDIQQRWGDEMEDEFQQRPQEVDAIHRQKHWNKQAGATAKTLFELLNKPVMLGMLAQRYSSNRLMRRLEIIRRVWIFFSRDPHTRQVKRSFRRKDSQILVEKLWVDVKEQSKELVLSGFHDRQILEADNHFLEVMKGHIFGENKQIYRYSFIRCRRSIDKLHSAAYFDCYFPTAVQFKEKLIESRLNSYEAYGVEEGNRRCRMEKTEYKTNITFKKNQIRRQQPSFRLDENFKPARKDPKGRRRRSSTPT